MRDGPRRDDVWSIIVVVIWSFLVIFVKIGLF